VFFNYFRGGVNRRELIIGRLIRGHGNGRYRLFLLQKKRTWRV